jgi:hypothetical protein
MEDGGGGILTPSGTSNSSLHNTNKTHTKQAQKLANSNTYKNQKNSHLNKTSTSSEQDHNTSLHKKCAIFAHQNLQLSDLDLPSELQTLISAWPRLPEHMIDYEWDHCSFIFWDSQHHVRITVNVQKRHNFLNSLICFLVTKRRFLLHRIKYMVEVKDSYV